MADKPLRPIEKIFLLHVERGDCVTVKRLLGEYRDNLDRFDLNCVDPLNRSALVVAIENENIQLIKILLDAGIQLKDALLHAIKEEYVEAVELLLEWEEKHTHSSTISSFNCDSSAFSSDITPLMLAAHKNNYEIVKLLLDRGATLPIPHSIKCDCDDCITLSKEDSLRHSHSRINAYRALISPSIIALSSKDPLLTAFELSQTLRKLIQMESEFCIEYREMRKQIQNFATSLLDCIRTSHELEIMLNYNPDGENWDPGERQTLARLRMAIAYKQKMFVAHPNVQQLLSTIWYEGVPGFRRKNIICQIAQVVRLILMFPIYCILYIVAPSSRMGRFISKPFVKFICHSASYMLFLGFVGAASQRLEIVLLELVGSESIKERVNEWKRKERGAFFGLAECVVIIYVASLIWVEIKSFWTIGMRQYISDLWNIVDFLVNTFYLLWITLRLCSWYMVKKEASQKKDPWYRREEWHSFDPMLLSEGAFAAGMIFSYLKLVYIFSVSPHLGPLQISLGRMIMDIVKFFFIYTLVLFAFACGLNQLLWYYAELEMHQCYTGNGEADFQNSEKACTIWRRYANLFETSQSLFWASFGLVDLLSFELIGIKSFTRFWALLMFGSYSVINVIILLNMFIAMMSNSYQIISERADTEWKFARSRLWLDYFDDDNVLPPPFNIFPNPQKIFRLICCIKRNRRDNSLQKCRNKAKERYELVIRSVVKRFITAEQQKKDVLSISEDDVREIRQDVSTLRYELISILKMNGMKTPQVSEGDSQVSGKRDKLIERRILKDFYIGASRKTVISESDNRQSGEMMGRIARLIRKKTRKYKTQDWNKLVQRFSDRRGSVDCSEECIIDLSDAPNLNCIATASNEDITPNDVDRRRRRFPTRDLSSDGVESEWI